MFQAGVKLLTAGDAQAALREFTAAAQNATDDLEKADALYNAAVCHVRLGDVDTAINVLAEALNVDKSLARDIIADDDFAPLRPRADFRVLLRKADPGCALFLAEVDPVDDEDGDDPLEQIPTNESQTTLPDYFPPSLPVRILRFVAAGLGTGGILTLVSGFVNGVFSIGNFAYDPMARGAAAGEVGMGITLLLAGMIVFVIAGLLGSDASDQLERDREAKRIADLAIDNDVTDPFALYLRPFSSTGNFRQKRRQVLAQEVTVGSSSPPREYSFELESMIAQVTHSWLPMVALGRPGEHFGSGRLPVKDDEWQEVVKSLVRQADVIFVVPDTSEGMLWELSHLRDERYLPKCVMIMPPNAAPDSWDAARNLLRPLGYRLPDHDVRGAMFRLTIEGKVEMLRRLPRRWSMRRLRRILHGFREPPQPSTGEDARSAAEGAHDRESV